MTATVWTILGVIGTALVGAVIGKLVSMVFERSAHLIVTVSVNESFKSPLLADEVREWRKKSMPIDEYRNEPWGMFGKYHSYFNSAKYIRLEVRNNSNKKLTGFSFCAHSVSSAVVQLGEGELLELIADVPVGLGDLQPNREKVLHVVAGSFWSYSNDQIKKALVFSADELGRVKYKFPFPFNAKLRLRNWASWAVLVGSVIFGFVLATILKG